MSFYCSGGWGVLATVHWRCGAWEWCTNYSTPHSYLRFCFQLPWPTFFDVCNCARFGIVPCHLSNKRHQRFPDEFFFVETPLEPSACTQPLATHPCVSPLPCSAAGAGGGLWYSRLSRRENARYVELVESGRSFAKMEERKRKRREENPGPDAAGLEGTGGGGAPRTSGEGAQAKNAAPARVGESHQRIRRRFKQSSPVADVGGGDGGGMDATVLRSVFGGGGGSKNKKKDG